MEDFPPQAKLLSEYTDEQKFSLIISHGQETDSMMKSRENRYPIEIAEILKDVEILWVDHINQATFDAICGLTNLKSLYIQSNRIKDVSRIVMLKNLEHLALLNFTKVESMSVLKEMVHLKTVTLENLKKVSDFTFLSELVDLVGLEIEGAMYASQKIDNFEFISTLKKLKYLKLINTKANSKDFTPLTNLVELEMFQSSANYPKSEFIKLDSLPHLKFIGGNIKDKIKNS